MKQNKSSHMAAFIYCCLSNIGTKEAQECVPKIYTTDSIYSGPQGKDSFVEVVGGFFPQI